MPRARSTKAWAWATVADPVTVWAGSAERLPLAHVRRNWAAAAEACWRRVVAADLPCATTKTPTPNTKARQMSPTSRYLPRDGRFDSRTQPVADSARSGFCELVIQTKAQPRWRGTSPGRGMWRG